MEFLTILLLLLLILLSGYTVALLRRPRTEDRLDNTLRDEFRMAREESARQARELREEVARMQQVGHETLVQTLTGLGAHQKEQLDAVSKAIREMTEVNRVALDKMNETLARQLRELQQGNERKLDQMRQVVDERLQTALDKRLGESFRLVSERLEAVQRGLGEMKSLADGVGDLKRVLTNVKTRGTWGEIQLGAILEQILTPEQYAANVAVRSDSGERVEFAVRLPGRADSADGTVWLPIDAKFPKEDYERLLDASQAADAEGVRRATEALIRGVRKCADEISAKYVHPPETTDFAILFLPTEGLFAEVLRQPGFHSELQQRYRVLAAGPTTLAAILNSLRMGFRTLAIEKRSSEVWQILGAVKTEFGKFGEVLDRVRKQVAAAGNALDSTASRTRAMERRLRSVEALPAGDTERVLQLATESANDADSPPVPDGSSPEKRDES
jgi:DNA recombination protein RmuC